MIFRTVKDRNYMIVSNDTYMKDKELSFGANVTMVAKYLGHAKIEETLNTYSHIFQNKLDDVVNTINNLNE